MRHASELSLSELQQLVAAIQELLYRDEDEQGMPFLNPDRTWEGADVCEELGQLMTHYELAPTKPDFYPPLSQGDVPDDTDGHRT
jgi:hypothetical protein